MLNLRKFGIDFITPLICTGGEGVLFASCLDNDGNKQFWVPLLNSTPIARILVVVLAHIFIHYFNFYNWSSISYSQWTMFMNILIKLFYLIHMNTITSC